VTPFARMEVPMVLEVLGKVACIESCFFRKGCSRFSKVASTLPARIRHPGKDEKPWKTRMNARVLLRKELQKEETHES
jgi:hypothetical protein